MGLQRFRNTGALRGEATVGFITRRYPRNFQVREELVPDPSSFFRKARQVGSWCSAHRSCRLHGAQPQPLAVERLRHRWPFSSR